MWLVTVARRKREGLGGGKREGLGWWKTHPIWGIFAGFTHEFFWVVATQFFFVYVHLYYLGFHDPIWRTRIFFRWVGKTHQLSSWLGIHPSYWISESFSPHGNLGVPYPNVMVSHRKLLTVFSVFQNPPVIPCEDWFFGTPTRSSLSRCLSKHLLHSAGICKTRIRGAFHHLLVP